MHRYNDFCVCETCNERRLTVVMDAERMILKFMLTHDVKILKFAPDTIIVQGEVIKDQGELES